MNALSALMETLLAISLIVAAISVPVALTKWIIEDSKRGRHDD